MQSCNASAKNTLKYFTRLSWIHL